MREIARHIQAYDQALQEKLNTWRRLFFEVLPDTEKSRPYKMPAFKGAKHPIYFRAYKKNNGLFPVDGFTEIENKVSEYSEKNAKDSLHFMLERPLAIE